MANVRFVGLFLLSQNERRALRVPLNASRIVIQGGNGFGKSAILKSIYETLGAAPQKIDNRWKSARVSSALVFEYDGARYTIVKAMGMHALFDSERKLLFSGQQVVRDWGPQLARFFGFKLIMSDRDGEIVIPPPSYIFAPFYIDPGFRLVSTLVVVPRFVPARQRANARRVSLWASAGRLLRGTRQLGRRQHRPVRA